MRLACVGSSVLHWLQLATKASLVSSWQALSGMHSPFTLTEPSSMHWQPPLGLASKPASVLHSQTLLDDGADR